MFTLASIFTSIITSFVISKAITWLAPKPDLPDFTQDADSQGVLVNKQSNNADIPVVYGKRLIGGTRVFLETSGTDNQYLYGALVLCEGEINNIIKIKVNDSDITFSGSFAHATEITSNDSRYGDTIRIQPFYGKDDQVASTLLTTLSSWTADHKLSGLAYIAFRITWNRDKYSGIPTIQAEIEGKKVPVINSNLSVSTNIFSDNPVFCLLDYLTNQRYGKGIDFGDIDLQSFYDASLVADTEVTPYSGASNIPLFSCNAVIDTGKKVMENTRILLKGMRGFLPYTKGVYRLIIETSGSSSLSLNENNIIGGLKVNSEKKNQKYNRVQANFINPSRGYQSDTIAYDDDHATLKAEDGGFLQEGIIDLPTITNPYQAQEFAEIVLKRSRNSLGLELVANYEALNLSIGDLVDVTSTITGFSAKPFRVIAMAINPDFSVALSLMEHQDAFYDFSEKNEVPIIPDTSFPDPFTILPPLGITLSSELISYNDGTVIVALNIDITPSTDNFVFEYQVEYRKVGETNFKVHAKGSELNQRILNVIDKEQYDVRVKAHNSLGVSSTYIIDTHTVSAFDERPSDVEDFTINIIGKDAFLQWEQIPDLGLAYYSLRYSSATTGATWNNSVSLVEKIARPATSVTVPSRVGSYLIRAVNKGNKLSQNATIVSTNIAQIGNFNAVATQTEEPTFSGAKTNCSVVDGTLKLDDFTSQGIYEFSSVIDLGGVFTSRVLANLEQFANDPNDLFEDGRGYTNFDDVPTNILFDGTEAEGANAHLEIAVSDDNITYSDFKNFVIGDYTARYYKFRVIMNSRDANSIPVLTGLEVIIDMEDRIISGDDITSGVTTYSVSFANPFKSTTYAIGITAQNMNTGDYYTISNKTSSGFDILFKDSTNSNISRDFDYIAKGY